MARSWVQRYYASAGQDLADGAVVPRRWEAAFDGHQTLDHSVPALVVRFRGRDEARGRITPTGVIGLNALCKHLVEEQRDPTLVGITGSPLEDGLLELTLQFRSGDSSMRYVYVVERHRPYVIRSWQVDVDAGEVILQAGDIRYHEFPGGVLYPVEGTRTEYERGTGALAEQMTFRVDTERTRIDPPGGIPDEVFRVTIPEGAEVIDADTGRPVSAEEKEILLAPHRLRERRIELPTSRPATQPAAGAGAGG